MYRHLCAFSVTRINDINAYFSGYVLRSARWRGDLIPQPRAQAQNLLDGQSTATQNAEF